MVLHTINGGCILLQRGNADAMSYQFGIMTKSIRLPVDSEPRKLLWWGVMRVL